MGLSLSTAVCENTQMNLRLTNTELQRKVIRLEKEIKAIIDKNIESMDMLNAELRTKTKTISEQKLYYEKELEHLEEKTAFFREKLTEAEKNKKTLESKNTELQKDNQKLLSAIKTIDEISDRFD